MLNSVPHFVILTLLVSFGETFRCFSCTSLVRMECEYIYVFFTTYHFMVNEMSKDCSKEQNACVSYAFGTDSFDSGFEEQRTLKYYIQRDCAIQPREDACNKVAEMLMLLNVTLFDPVRNCHWCNGTSLCNNLAIGDVTSHINLAPYIHSATFKFVLASFIALVHRFL
uniref:Uncharacterized protein n=2 Tax=Lygus hesperus TaxID=30085 RepID=A0A0A9VRK8_LYGHE